MGGVPLVWKQISYCSFKLWILDFLRFFDYEFLTPMAANKLICSSCFIMIKIQQKLLILPQIPDNVSK